MIGKPPSSYGACHERSTKADPATAVKPLGAVGNARGVAEMMFGVPGPAAVSGVIRKK